MQEHIASLIGEKSIVIARKSNAVVDSLQSVGFDVLNVEKQVLLTVRSLQATCLHGRNVLILISSFLTSFLNRLLQN